MKTGAAGPETDIAAVRAVIANTILIGGDCDRGGC
jgi:hypothetical protein